MKRSFLPPILLIGIVALWAAPGSGAPADTAGTVPLDLTAGAPVLQPAGDRLVVPRIEGFGLTSRPGEPMLPLRVLLVAIPEGSVPELVVLSAPSSTIDAVSLAPVPMRRLRDREEEPDRPAAKARATAESADFTPDARLFARDADEPEAPVRFGRVGYLREQRFVEVLYTPVVYNPVRHRLRLFAAVKAEVRFTIPPGVAAAIAGRAFRPDPWFEETYRRSLVNYEQGKLYRVGRAEAARAPRDAPAPVAAPFAAATTPAAAGGAPRYKIMVSTQGIYHLDYNYLSANAPDLLAYDPATFVLTAEGVEVPISIRAAGGGAGGAGGLLNPGDFLEFFGRPKTEPPTVLNYDFGSTFPDVYEANDFTDTQVYWLTSSGAAGSHLRVPKADASPIHGYPTASDFQDTAVWDENNIYLPIGSADPFFSMPSLLAGSTAAARDLTLGVPGISRSGTTASVTVRLRGGSDLTSSPDHRTQAWLNNDTTDATDFTWDGITIAESTFAVPQSVLSDPTTIHLDAPGLSGITLDRQYPDTVSLVYRRLFAAVGDALSFSYPNQSTRFQVSGFSAAEPTIYDVSRTIAGSNEASPVLLTGAAVSGSPTTTFTFEVGQDTSAGAPATRVFHVAGPGAIRLPDAMVRAADPVLQDPANAADLIVIGARDTLDPTSPSLDNLLLYRQQSQGLTSKVVFIDQIYDEFSFGLRNANAIRSFLAYAYGNWKGTSGTARPPSFVLLVGDATPDYKNTLNDPGYVDQVPTPMMFQVSSILGYYSSDNWLASFLGADQVPDVYLGRISTRTIADSNAVFDKILRYETAPPPGLWKGHAILVASDGKFPGDSDSFEQVDTAVAQTYFAQAPYSVPSPPLYFDNPPWNATDVAGFKTALIGEIDSGSALLFFVGHGSFETWGLNTFFTTTDAQALTNGSLLPFMVNVNCLTGGFHFLGAEGSVGEGMTNNPSGGAIATFAPSGLSSVFVGTTVGDGVNGPLFGPQEQRVLGPAASNARAVLWSQGSIIDLQSFTFLGDPATTLVTPAPAPPGGLSATAGNAQVTLAWTAPAQPAAGTRIERATDPAGPYAAVTCDALSPTSCVDRTAQNATTYYYYAVSLDADGFWGPASNFNTGCATGGPDCVSARPLNPGPPAAPAGLAATDPGSGGRLLVTWLPNTETDLKSYTLYYGTQPGNGTVPGAYTSRVTVGPTTTSLTLTGLTDSVRYYMALTATNTSGHESAPSAEATGVSHLIQGIAPPRSITDLDVTRSAGDLVLTWSRPTVDIYGRPTTVVGYRVYRGATPAFMPFATGPLATIADGAITTYTDAGAALAAGNGYYLVTAVDTSGLESGAGRELPNGVGDLAVSVPSVGTVRLAWSAITTDVAGLPTIIDHYQIHMGSKPIPRASLGPATLYLDNVRALSVDLTPAGAPLYFSVIAVDDRGNLSPF